MFDIEWSDVKNVSKLSTIFLVDQPHWIMILKYVPRSNSERSRFYEAQW